MKTTKLNVTPLAAFVAATVLASPVYAAEETMVVTASGFEQTIKDAPASISVITKDDLAKKPFRDLTDALADIPGVNVTGGAGSTDISLRGMDAKYTLILVDGKRQNSRETRPNRDGAGIEQGWIPPLSAIERIEVIRGPMSSLYGSDAMGGVINIITRKVSDTWGGSLRMEHTFQENSDSKDISTTDFFLNSPLINNKLGLQLYGKYATRAEDEYKTGYPEQRLSNINGKLTYTPNDRHTFDVEVGSSLQKRIATAAKTASKKDSEHRSRRSNQSVSHRGIWDFATTELRFSHEKTDNYSRQMEVDNKALDAQALIPLNNHMVTVGGQYYKETLDDHNNLYNPNVSKLDRWRYAIFLEDEYRITDYFALTGGIRYDKDENYGDHWNPRGYAVWNLDDNWTLKGGVSTGFTAPALRQVVSDWGQPTGGDSSSGLILGNPDLKPEKSVNYEMSLNYANDTGLSGSVTGYYTDFKDKIQLFDICRDEGKCVAPNGDGGYDFIQSRENVDKASLHGVEVTGKIPLPMNFTLSGSYTWSESEQKSGENKGRGLNNIPKHRATSTLDWQAREDLNFWTRVTFNGKETTYMRKRQNEPKENPSYTLVDLGGSYKFNQATTLYTGIYNLLDKEIREDNFDKTLDGRRYWIGLNVDF